MRTGVDVAERMHAVGAHELDAGGDERRLPRVVVEGVARDGVALPGAKDELRPLGRVPTEVLGELDGDGVGQRHGPRLPPFWRGQVQARAEQPHLLLDVDLAAQEVDVAHAQPKALDRLASNESDDCAEPHLVGRRTRLGDCPDLLRVVAEDRQQDIQEERENGQADDGGEGQLEMSLRQICRLRRLWIS